MTTTMAMKSIHCLLLALLCSIHFLPSSAEDGQDSSVVLTYENFNEKTAGKTVFIKFFSPSCGHCQDIAPYWERMAQEWVQHEQGLVGAVDCTTEGQLCTSLKFTGLPTLLYGEPSAAGVLLREYSEEKTYEGMAEFAKATLTTPICSPVNLDLCEEKERNQMMYFLSLGEWELGSVIKDRDGAIQLARDVFDASFQAMQSEHDLIGTEYEIEKSRINSKIKILKGILDMKKTD